MIEQVFREEWGRVLASLIGYFGDFDLAEDAAAEAFAIAALRWSCDGVPDSPVAWLVTTARRRAIDRLRRDRVLAAKLRLLAAEPDTGDSMDTTAIPDERLELVFTCCHPALAVEAQVALTLRAVGGPSTEETARAFLVPPETMKRRLTRAKSKIKVAGIPFSVPSGTRLPEGLGAVLAVVYLIFNEGYGDPDRTGPARPGRRGDPARRRAGRPAPGRARGARRAGADAAVGDLLALFQRSVERGQRARLHLGPPLGHHVPFDRQVRGHEFPKLRLCSSSGMRTGNMRSSTRSGHQAAGLVPVAAVDLTR